MQEAVERCERESPPGNAKASDPAELCAFLFAAGHGITRSCMSTEDILFAVERPCQEGAGKVCIFFMDSMDSMLPMLSNGSNGLSVFERALNQIS
jgi:hypothetical protein